MVDRPYPQWTIQKCNQIIHAKKQNIEEMREHSQCELLELGMRTTLEKRIEMRETLDIRNRVFGPND
ncbi:3-alpha domain-containing protein [Bacillus sp. ISL-7]|uniref:3-alpha domain-containing protein n=1 Tax=Bacillus sp. ISL-7 TaxID=2819136 RepID=UPI001BED1FE9|nr:3-alpha domain-containing protein [Bacillus sp. ISL-7]MBT2733934.1 hypothetical protein [Bacillus sp. ISL-7]